MIVMLLYKLMLNHCSKKSFNRVNQFCTGGGEVGGGVFRGSFGHGSLLAITDFYLAKGGHGQMAPKYTAG